MPSGPCALVLIEDAAAERGAHVPEHIALQPLERAETTDANVPARDDEVPGMRPADLLDRAVVVGRDAAKVDVAMDCESIPLLLSRRHAALTCDGTTHYVRDLATTNGTFVNGQRVEAKVDVALRDGDVVAFGGPRYVARGSGKLANPFRFRYVRLERGGVDEDGRVGKRRRASEDGRAATDAAEGDWAPASQVYQAVQASQNSETDEELDDMLRSRLRRVFEGEDDFAQACAKRYFGVVSPVTSPPQVKKKMSATNLDLVGKVSDARQPHRSIKGSQNLTDDEDGLKEMLSQMVVERLRDRPAWVETELKCGICHEWMTNPHSVITCGHMFCLECIDNSFCHSYTCPFCRSRPHAPREFLFAPSTLANKLLDEYVIPTLTTKELQLRRAKEASAKEARNRRVKRAAELLSTATFTNDAASVPATLPVFESSQPSEP